MQSSVMIGNENKTMLNNMNSFTDNKILNVIGKERCKYLVNGEYIYMSHFAYACKTEGKNDISHLFSKTA